MNNRIPQLDSIRGLASLSVLLHHMYLATPILPLLFWQSPLRVFINGRGAVLLFFVLSGFVLSLPYFNGKKVPYLTFIIKRIFRIYVPYVIAILAAIAACSLLSTNTKFNEGWINDFWKIQPDLNAILEHLNLIGNIHTDYFNTVIWSLIHEMRISLIFPFVVILVKRLNIRFNLILCAGLSVLAGSNDIFQIHQSNGFNTSYFDSVHYLSVFIMGALLSKHRSEIARFYKRISTSVKWTLLGASLFMYSYSAAIDSFFNFPFNDKIADYGVTLAAVIFVIFAINSTRVTVLLLNKSALFLGKISYSLYLYHMTVLLSCLYLLQGTIPMWIINLLIFVSGIMVAYICWYLIENNAVKVANHITLNRKENKSTRVSLSLNDGGTQSTTHD